MTPATVASTNRGKALFVPVDSGTRGTSRQPSVAARLVPLLERYREWMTANNYPANVALMQGVYSAAWLAFAMYIAVAVMWFIPDRRIERTLAE